MVVTNARFVVGGQTYVMRNITSIKSGVIPPPEGGVIALVLLAFAAFMSGAVASHVIIGLIGAVILGSMAFLVRRSLKPEFTVSLHTSAGEIQALKSANKQFIENVLAALNNAVIQQG